MEITKNAAHDMSYTGEDIVSSPSCNTSPTGKCRSSLSNIYTGSTFETYGGNIYSSHQRQRNHRGSTPRAEGQVVTLIDSGESVK